MKAFLTVTILVLAQTAMANSYEFYFGEEAKQARSNIWSNINKAGPSLTDLLWERDKADYIKFSDEELDAPFAYRSLYEKIRCFGIQRASVSYLQQGDPHKMIMETDVVVKILKNEKYKDYQREVSNEVKCIRVNQESAYGDREIDTDVHLCELNFCIVEKID